MKTLGALLGGALLLNAIAMPTSAQTQASTSLSLDDAITKTITRNPQLQAFGFAMRAQDGRILQAGLKPKPTLIVEVEDALGTGAAQGLSQANATVSIAWILEGELRQQRIDVAITGSQVLASQAQIMRLDAAAQTARYYTLALEQQLHREIADAGLQLARETVAAVELRVEAASTNRAELARAQADLARRALYREDIDHEITSARHLLAAQWGELEPQFDTLTGAPLVLPTIEAIDVLLSRIEQNPELDKFLSEQRLQESILRLERTAQNDPWRVSAGLRRIQNSADFGIVAQVNIPLNFGNRNQGRIQEVQETIAQSAAEREAAKVRIQTQLLRIYLELEHSIHRANTLREEVVPRFEEALVEIRRAYDLGSASYLERLEVQEELLLARSDLAETSIQAHLDLIEIERLTGTRVAQLTPIERGTP
jgi:cobalt-zinc-cadmium efflux system outer membrane protein